MKYILSLVSHSGVWNGSGQYGSVWFGVETINTVFNFIEQEPYDTDSLFLLLLFVLSIVPSADLSV